MSFYDKLHDKLNIVRFCDLSLFNCRLNEERHCDIVMHDLRSAVIPNGSSIGNDCSSKITSIRREIRNANSMVTATEHEFMMREYAI